MMTNFVSIALLALSALPSSFTSPISNIAHEPRNGKWQKTQDSDWIQDIISRHESRPFDGTITSYDTRQYTKFVLEQLDTLISAHDSHHHGHDQTEHNLMLSTQSQSQNTSTNLTEFLSKSMAETLEAWAQNDSEIARLFGGHYHVFNQTGLELPLHNQSQAQKVPIQSRDTAVQAFSPVLAIFYMLMWTAFTGVLYWGFIKDHLWKPKVNLVTRDPSNPLNWTITSEDVMEYTKIVTEQLDALKLTHDNIYPGYNQTSHELFLHDQIHNTSTIQSRDTALPGLGTTNAVQTIVPNLIVVWLIMMATVGCLIGAWPFLAHFKHLKDKPGGRPKIKLITGNAAPQPFNETIINEKMVPFTKFVIEQLEVLNSIHHSHYPGLNHTGHGLPLRIHSQNASTLQPRDTALGLPSFMLLPGVLLGIASMYVPIHLADTACRKKHGRSKIQLITGNAPPQPFSSTMIDEKIMPYTKFVIEQIEAKTSGNDIHDPELLGFSGHELPLHMHIQNASMIQPRDTALSEAKTIPPLFLVAVGLLACIGIGVVMGVVVPKHVPLPSGGPMMKLIRGNAPAQPFNGTVIDEKMMPYTKLVIEQIDALKSGYNSHNAASHHNGLPFHVQIEAQKASINHIKFLVKSAQHGLVGLEGTGRVDAVHMEDLRASIRKFEKDIDKVKDDIADLELEESEQIRKAAQHKGAGVSKIASNGTTTGDLREAARRIDLSLWNMFYAKLDGLKPSTVWKTMVHE